MPEHVIVANAADVAQAAARRLVAVIEQVQAERGSATVVLTGGGTGIAMLAAVRENPGAVDFSAVNLFFGDERFLPEGDPERNYVQAREALLDHVPVDPARVHPIAASDGPLGNDPVAAAAEYEAVLGAPIGSGAIFDVHLLGMGGEGHINSLFPDTDAVQESERLVIAVNNSPKPPPVRVTLTLPAVRRARRVWLLVSGEGKAAAVAAAIGGAQAVDVPAAGAVGIDETVWFLDEAAAAQLPG